MTRRIFVFEMLLVLAALAATAIAWPHLPASVPMHWNIHFQPDRYGSRGTLFLIGPGLMVSILVLTCLLPWLSPKPFGVDSFRAAYRQIMLILFGMMTYLYAVLLWAAFGQSLDAGRAIGGGVCLFVALIGNQMGKLRRNFYIGVRTPWTLASERVWNATHRFAARITVAAGLLGLLLSIAGLPILALFCVIAAALASVLYSLVYYKQLESRGELDPQPVQGSPAK